VQKISNLINLQKAPGFGDPSLLKNVFPDSLENILGIDLANADILNLNVQNKLLNYRRAPIKATNSLFPTFSRKGAPKLPDPLDSTPNPQTSRYLQEVQALTKKNLNIK